MLQPFLDKTPHHPLDATFRIVLSETEISTSSCRFALRGTTFRAMAAAACCNWLSSVVPASATTARASIAGCANPATWKRSIASRYACAHRSGAWRLTMAPARYDQFRPQLGIGAQGFQRLDELRLGKCVWQFPYGVVVKVGHAAIRVDDDGLAVIHAIQHSAGRFASGQGSQLHTDVGSREILAENRNIRPARDPHVGGRTELADQARHVLPVLPRIVLADKHQMTGRVLCQTRCSPCLQQLQVQLHRPQQSERTDQIVAFRNTECGARASPVEVDIVVSHVGNFDPVAKVAAIPAHGLASNSRSGRSGPSSESPPGCTDTSRRHPPDPLLMALGQAGVAVVLIQRLRQATRPPSLAVHFRNDARQEKSCRTTTPGMTSRSGNM